MIDSITSAFSAIKDGVVTAAARSYLNGKIAGFGSVTRLELDSKQRTALVEVELKGEPTPISIKVGAYSVVERDGVKYVTVRDVQSSREWIALAVAQYAAGREFKIPDSFGGIL